MKGPRPCTQDDFIRKARATHGDLYSYDCSVFVGRLKPVAIRCPEHGIWHDRPSSHWRGCGCPDCREQAWSPDPFQNQLQKVHGARYKVVNDTDLRHVTMSCVEHGNFSHSANAICKAAGCPTCGRANKDAHALKTTEEFIQAAEEVHQGKFDYSQTVYTKSTEHISVICPKHGVFRTVPVVHLQGHDCSRCAADKQAANTKHSQEWFVTNAVDMFGEAYTYDRSVYSGMNKQVVITCPKHGDFQQMPTNFLKGWGCRECSDKHPGLHSKKACDWLDDVAALDGTHIQHALNGGEHLIKEINKKVDGFGTENGEIYEFHGGRLMCTCCNCFNISI